MNNKTGISLNNNVTGYFFLIYQCIISNFVGFLFFFFFKCCMQVIAKVTDACIDNRFYLDLVATYRAIRIIVEQ